MREAIYWGVAVTIVLMLEHWALVRRGDGLSFVVEVGDLTAIPALGKVENLPC
jgi:hypothetical protein